MRLIALALVLPATASAGGYYFSDSGIVAMSRGGAWVASADNQFAQRYNPAGLIKVERPSLNLGIAGVAQSVTFDAISEDGDALGAVSNDAPPFVVPQLGFAMPIGENFGFALGMHSPYAPSYAYDATGPQRYMVVDSAIYQFQFGPSLAWRPHPIVTIGAGVNMQVFWIQQSLKITTGGSIEPGGDVAIDVAVRDGFTPGFDLGLLIEPVEQLSIGFSVLPASKYNAGGNINIDFTGSSLEGMLEAPVYQDGDCDASSTDVVCTDEDGVNLGIQLPTVLRAGVAVRPVEELEVEVAFVYQTWSNLKDLKVTNVDVILDTSIGEQEVDSEFTLTQSLSNSWSLRLGGQYRVSDLLELRAGGFYEPSAVEPDYLTAGLVDADKVQVGGGGSLYINDGALRFDFAGAFLAIANTEVRSSEVVQVNAGVFNDDVQAVGNGDYTTSGFLVGLQATYAFGDRKRDEF